MKHIVRTGSAALLFAGYLGGTAGAQESTCPAAIDAFTREYEEALGTDSVGEALSPAEQAELFALQTAAERLYAEGKLEMCADVIRRADLMLESAIAPRVLDPDDLAGREVVDSEGEGIGEIERVMLDPMTGRIAYVLVEHGGFLGIGSNLFAVPWRALTFVPGDEQSMLLDITEERLENAPRFPDGDLSALERRAWVLSVHTYYGVEPYWQDDMPAMTFGPGPEAGAGQAAAGTPAGTGAGTGQPAVTEGAGQGAAPGDAAQSAAPQDAGQPSASEGIGQSATPQGTGQSATPQGTGQSVTPQGAGQPTASEGAGQPAAAGSGDAPAAAGDVERPASGAEAVPGAEEGAPAGEPRAPDEREGAIETEGQREAAMTVPVVEPMPGPDSEAAQGSQSRDAAAPDDPTGQRPGAQARSQAGAGGDLAAAIAALEDRVATLAERMPEEDLGGAIAGLERRFDALAERVPESGVGEALADLREKVDTLAAREPDRELRQAVSELSERVGTLAERVPDADLGQTVAELERRMETLAGSADRIGQAMTRPDSRTDGVADRAEGRAAGEMPAAAGGADSGAEDRARASATEQPSAGTQGEVITIVPIIRRTGAETGDQGSGRTDGSERTAAAAGNGSSGQPAARADVSAAPDTADQGTGRAEVGAESGSRRQTAVGADVGTESGAANEGTERAEVGAESGSRDQTAAGAGVSTDLETADQGTEPAQVGEGSGSTGQPAARVGAESEAAGQGTERAEVGAASGSRGQPAAGVSVSTDLEAAGQGAESAQVGAGSGSLGQPAARSDAGAESEAAGQGTERAEVGAESGSRGQSAAPAGASAESQVAGQGTERAEAGATTGSGTGIAADGGDRLATATESCQAGLELVEGDLQGATEPGRATDAVESELEEARAMLRVNAEALCRAAVRRARRELLTLGYEPRMPE